MNNDCEECNGEGFHVREVIGFSHHPSCDGTCREGLCPVPEQQLEQEPCELCQGTGRILKDDLEYDPNCKRCHGTGCVYSRLYDPPEQCDCMRDFQP